MTDEQKARIAELLGEIEAILNAAGIDDDVFINCHRIPVQTMGMPDWSVYEVQMEVIRSEILKAKRG